MRAALLTEAGKPPAFGELPAPDAVAGSTVIDVLAAALNPVDLQLAANASASRDRPVVPGREAVGRAPDGKRVYVERATPPYGSLAERALADTQKLIPVPDGVDDATAVAFGVAGLAGWVSLEWRAGLRRGEVVLVLGGGAVGQVALQAARLLGSARVVVATRSEASRARARELGADATVALDGDDPAAAIRDASGGGVDVIVDTLWGAAAAAALRAGRSGARLVQIGEAAGPEASLAAAPLRMSQMLVLGYANAAVPFGIKRAAYERMLRHALASELRLVIETMPLERVAEAWERQESGTGTKLVLAP